MLFVNQVEEKGLDSIGKLRKRIQKEPSGVGSFIKRRQPRATDATGKAWKLGLFAKQNSLQCKTEQSQREENKSVPFSQQIDTAIKQDSEGQNGRITEVLY